MADDRERELEQYLLGGLPEPTMLAIEQSYFADPAMFERVEQAEHALIDDFLEQRLTRAELDQFETHFLAAPARAKRVAIARALRETATEAVLRDQRRAASPSARLWLALAASIAVAAVLWFVVARPSPPPAQRAGPPGSTQPTPQVAEPPQPAREPSFVALVLSPVSTRSTEPAVEIRSTTGARVEIDLLGSGPRAAGRVEIRSVDAGVVWTGEARPAGEDDARSAIAHATVPMDRLPHGDYILTLWSASASPEAAPVGTYYFRVSPPQGVDP